jgi:hypothetical protein
MSELCFFFIRCMSAMLPRGKRSRFHATSNKNHCRLRLREQPVLRASEHLGQSGWTDSL